MSILWTPSPQQAEATLMAEFQRWLQTTKGLEFADYNALWTWSTEEPEAFWSAIIAFFDLPVRNIGAVMGRREMPGAEWFPQARLNFAETVLSHVQTRPDQEALVLHSETFGIHRLTWAQLGAEVARVASGLRALGVGQGDRVAAILPNTHHCMIAFLAVASLGAIWSVASPDMGPVAVLDRFRQIAPKVLIAQDSYTNAGRQIDRRPEVARIAEGLPSLAARVLVPAHHGLAEGWLDWQSLAGDGDLQLQSVEFSHPLWIVYSSGTTGAPKPIIHGHGGIALEFAKAGLHLDVTKGDRYAWVTASGWIMWNVQLAPLMHGATLVLIDRAAAYPDLMALWQLASEERLTHFGAGAAWFQACLKAGISPKTLDLQHLWHLGSTGSPLSPEAYEWIYAEVKSDLWLAPLSGGTDFAGAFVGGNPMLPVRAGVMQCRFLGSSVAAFTEEGEPRIGEVGELVCTRPMPSMPLGFWGDEDGSRYREAYFEMFPGIWRHGDWIEITPEGGAVIYGRSDSTINRMGLRLGSSEIYRAVEALEEVADSLIVDLEYLGKPSELVLFVVMAGGRELEGSLEAIKARIRQDVSPRFLPDTIVATPEIPRTLSGKKLEVPVRKLLLGQSAEKVASRDSMANPAAFDWFLDYAKARQGA